MRRRLPARVRRATGPRAHADKASAVAARAARRPAKAGRGGRVDLAVLVAGRIEMTPNLQPHARLPPFPLWGKAGMGARPMSRLIQTTIRKALADELLFGKLAEGGRVTVDWDNKLGDVQWIVPTAKSDRELAQACE